MTSDDLNASIEACEKGQKDFANTLKVAMSKALPQKSSTRELEFVSDRNEISVEQRANAYVYKVCYDKQGAVIFSIQLEAKGAGEKEQVLIQRNAMNSKIKQDENAPCFDCKILKYQNAKWEFVSSL